MRSKCGFALLCPAAPSRSLGRSQGLVLVPRLVSHSLACLFLLTQAGLAPEFIPLSLSLGDFIYCFCPFPGSEGILLDGLSLHWRLQYNQCTLFIFPRD